MISNFELGTLIERGGVYTDVEGTTPQEIYQSLTSLVQMPEGCTRQVMFQELSDREKILSTAVGHGIAIPHPRKPLLTREDEQRIIVCFPKTPVSMSSPDSQKVFVMFVLLSQSNHFHLQVLSALARILGDDDFRLFLASKPSCAELTARISTHK